MDDGDQFKFITSPYPMLKSVYVAVYKNRQIYEQFGNSVYKDNELNYHKKLRESLSKEEHVVEIGGSDI